MLQKIQDLRTIDDFFIIDLKNGREKKIEINELGKISIRVVKRRKIFSFLILVGLNIINFIFLDTLKSKIEGAFFILLFFMAIYNCYRKQYRLVMNLHNNEKYQYEISSRSKLAIKEKVLHLRNIQFKHNFK